MGHRKFSSLDEAVKVLKEESGENSQGNLFRAESKSYSKKFNPDLSDIKDKVEEQLGVARDKAVKMSKHAIKSVDKYGHKKPWVLIGWASLFAAILGFILGRKTR